jgi:hypothetical protein
VEGTSPESGVLSLRSKPLAVHFSWLGSEAPVAAGSTRVDGASP